MQIETLKLFCDVVRWGNFSRGALENQVSQPKASQAVGAIEKHLGVKLIDRSHRPFVLTPQGRTFYEGCKDLVGRYLEVENRVKAFDDAHQVVGTVAVASIYSVGLHHITHYVKTFGELNPGATVRLEFLHPTRVVESVCEGGVDLGIISFPRKSSELTVIPWREEEMVLAVHPTHPFAGRERVPVAELDGQRFISYDCELPIRRAIDRFLRHHDVQVEVVMEFDNIENVKRAVEIPEGIALLPEPTVAREVESGALVALGIDGQDPGHRLTRPLAVIHRRNRPLSLTTTRFLRFLTGDAAPAPLPAGARADRHLSAQS